MTDEETVLATLEDYADAYCAKDIMRLMAVFDDGDDISLIGTGADEFCERRSEIEAVFSPKLFRSDRDEVSMVQTACDDGRRVCGRRSYLDHSPKHSQWPPAPASAMDCCAVEEVWPLALAP